MRTRVLFIILLLSHSYFSLAKEPIKVEIAIYQSNKTNISISFKTTDQIAKFWSNDLLVTSTNPEINQLHSYFVNEDFYLTIRGAVETIDSLKIDLYSMNEPIKRFRGRKLMFNRDQLNQILNKDSTEFRFKIPMRYLLYYIHDTTKYKTKKDHVKYSVSVEGERLDYKAISIGLIDIDSTIHWRTSLIHQVQDQNIAVFEYFIFKSFQDKMLVRIFDDNSDTTSIVSLTSIIRSFSDETRDVKSLFLDGESSKLPVIISETAFIKINQLGLSYARLAEITSLRNALIKIIISLVLFIFINIYLFKRASLNKYFFYSKSQIPQ